MSMPQEAQPSVQVPKVPFRVLPRSDRYLAIFLLVAAAGAFVGIFFGDADARTVAGSLLVSLYALVLAGMVVRASKLRIQRDIWRNLTRKLVANFTIDALIVALGLGEVDTSTCDREEHVDG